MKNKIDSKFSHPSTVRYSFAASIIAFLLISLLYIWYLTEDREIKNIPNLYLEIPINEAISKEGYIIDLCLINTSSDLVHSLYVGAVNGNDEDSKKIKRELFGTSTGSGIEGSLTLTIEIKNVKT